MAEFSQIIAGSVMNMLGDTTTQEPRGAEAELMLRLSRAITSDTAGALTIAQPLVLSAVNIDLDDNQDITFGTGNDATILYDATDLIINPAVVGTGRVIIDGANGATALELKSGTSSMEFRIREPSGGGSDYVGFKTPALAASIVFTLPSADGTSNQALTTDGSLALSFTTVLVSPLTADLTYNDNVKATFGTGGDADLSYDATNLILDTAVDGSGELVLTQGKINFPDTQIASSDANTIDDYEEGTWTPVIGGSGGTSGQSYATQIGRYIKIGRRVWASFTAILSTEGTITTNVEIQGLPFTSETVASDPQMASLRFSNWPVNWITVNARVGSAGTVALIIGSKAAAGNNETIPTATDIDDDSEIRGTIEYESTD